MESMRNRTAAFTGHRSIPAAELPTLIARLDVAIAELVNQGVVFFGSGMARGFDTIAAQAVLKVKATKPAVKLIAVLPCYDQDSKWRDFERAEYRCLLDAADKVVYVSKQPYFDGCMALRNRHLVENSGVCVAYKAYERSGTGQTVRMAREQGLRVINLHE